MNQGRKIEALSRTHPTLQQVVKVQTLFPKLRTKKNDGHWMCNLPQCPDETMKILQSRVVATPLPIDGMGNIMPLLFSIRVTHFKAALILWMEEILHQLIYR